MNPRHLAIPLAALTISCGPGVGTETGNPDAQLRVAITGWSSNQQAITLQSAAAPEPTSPIRIDTALMGVEKLWMIRGENCDVPEPAEPEHDEALEDKQVLDLTDRVEVERVLGTGDRFCRVRIELEDGEEMSHPLASRLGDGRIRIEGYRSNGTRFVLLSDAVRELDIRSTDPAFSVAEGETAITLAFDVARWLEGVILDAAVPTDGTAYIDEDNNESVLQQFESNVSGSGTAVWGRCDEDAPDDYADSCSCEFGDD